MQMRSDFVLNGLPERSSHGMTGILVFVFACTVGSGPGFSQDLEGRSCWKPSAPVKSDYQNETEYSAAQEEYYSQATFYLSCLDSWVKDTEARYREMFEAEIEAYAFERAELLDEIRAFTNALRP